MFGNLDTWSAQSDAQDLCQQYKEIQVLNSQTAHAISSLSKLVTENQIKNLRKQATLSCNVPSKEISPCKPLNEPCIFDLESDPCETHNLYNMKKDILGVLEAEMSQYMAAMVAPCNRRADTMANPKYWNNTWTYWQDLSQPSESGQHMVPQVMH